MRRHHYSVVVAACQCSFGAFFGRVLAQVSARDLGDTALLKPEFGERLLFCTKNLDQSPTSLIHGLIEIVSKLRTRLPKIETFPDLSPAIASPAASRLGAPIDAAFRHVQRLGDFVGAGAAADANELEDIGRSVEKIQTRLRF